jgi:hypothetical protein|nr:MAG TPA: hypothetical protein [Bacteriophage sp.]
MALSSVKISLVYFAYVPVTAENKKAVRRNALMFFRIIIQYLDDGEGLFV